jgi:uncharacterized membrane protein
LLLANLFWGLYVGLPFLAPALMNAGLTTPARIIYIVYRPLCHQLPERSYFLGGGQHAYTAEELAAGGVEIAPLSRDIGNETVGYKVAFCQRDVAIYGSIFLAGLAYGLIRRRWSGWKMPFRYYLLFLVPMGIDGILQLLGLHESDWILRTITGAVFGVGSVLLAYPYLEEGMRDVRQSIAKRHHLQD